MLGASQSYQVKSPIEDPIKAFSFNVYDTVFFFIIIIIIIGMNLLVFGCNKS
jgi:hypothetical protein